MLSFGLCIAALVTIFVSYWVHRWRNPRCNGVLPPGSMGLPLLGETLHLLIPGRSLDMHPFLKKRIQRYGTIFRTSLAGRPVVVSADAEFNHNIFLQEGRSVELWYLDTFSKLFNQDGESRTNGVGSVHRFVRSIVLNHFGPERLKEKMLSQIEEMVDKTLHNWSSQSAIEVKHAVSTMVFDFTAKYMFSYDPEKSSEKVGENMGVLLKGLMSFPLNIPGTEFHKCMKAQKKVMSLIKEKMKEKRSSPEAYQGDLLDQAIKEMETETFLTEDFVIPFIFGALFASFESISSALTLAFGLLSEHPLVVEELMAENNAILKSRGENVDSPFTWDEYRSMSFTPQVVNEILRLSNVAPGLLRRSLKEIHANGYTIPAGWTIMLATSAQQLDPNTFKDPLVFNPWRWKELDANVISKNYMPFGGGMRQCAGAEYSKAFMAAFLHVVVTKYRWTKIKGGDISRTPFLDFGKGMHIKVSAKA
ncbi:hypothetical protein RJ640_003241 [Escallonia rubra]|uniref:Cytochrome P450 87A3 n=1 Tax=Escallonia rubra TaxID=112253 RepID=A0AA88QXZ5_9ASTE|nr:hypothetical protein RJ640_003241 [Escallonia rubra]